MPERIVLRPAETNKCEVVTYRYDNGYVTPVMHYRTLKWHATKDIPTIQPDGWTHLDETTTAHRTKREAVASLG